MSSYGIVGQTGNVKKMSSQISSINLQNKKKSMMIVSKSDAKIDLVKKVHKNQNLMKPEEWNKQPPLIKIQTPKMLKPLLVSTYK